MIDAEPALQQPCIHCGECAQVCPDALDPEALFFALVRDDFGAARAGRLDACRECNLCVAACPSHIPLLDWLRWGKSEAAFRTEAGIRRHRYIQRNVRLARERTGRTAMRAATRTPAAAASPAQTISRADVLAAIARGRQRKARTHGA